MLEGINNRVDKAEDQISDLEDKEAEKPQSEQLKEKRIKNEDHTRSLCDNFKHINSHIMGLLGREERARN